MMEIPMFLVGGFLDSGKSSFILDAIEKDGFDKKGRTLIVLCEEGEIEISSDLAKNHNTKVVTVTNEEDFTSELLSKYANEYIPDRVIVELNCMWDLNKICIPEEYQLKQVLTFVDGSTFPIYYNNMREKFSNLFKLSDLVIFNKCNNPTDLLQFQTSLKMISATTQYLIMGEDGVAKKLFEEPLPYDINAKLIEISNDDFARWYIDTFDNPERYRGKIVSFNGTIIKNRLLPKGSFIVGRNAMTCCAADVQMYGHLCKGDLGKKIKNNGWIKIVARVEFEFSDEYQEDECVLYPISIEIIEPIENPILDLR